MSTGVLEIVLIVVACWIGVSLAALPLVMLLGRAGRRADADAERLHARATVARKVAEPAHALRPRARQT